MIPKTGIILLLVITHYNINLTIYKNMNQFEAVTIRPSKSYYDLKGVKYP